MAHQSGIRVSDELAARFISALNDTTTRALKVSIVNESLEAADEQTVGGTFDEDFAHVASLLHDTDPCYVLVRQDLAGNKWLFCAYIPDSAKVRDKMLYASTRATATKMLGDSYFVDSLYGTTRDEFSLAGYEQHRRHEESSAPLTERELELERIKEIESSSVDAPTLDTRRSHVTGVSFDIDEQAREALRSFASGTVNFVLLAVDSKNERVLLDRSESLQDHGQVAECFPDDMPRFAYYWYDSTTVMFIYACPSSSN
ncbi:Twinfilin-1, partial [Linderina pennispora]